MRAQNLRNLNQFWRNKLGVRDLSQQAEP
jgi:hypothetical protein